MKPQKRIGYLLTIATLFVLSCDLSTLVAPQQIHASAPGTIGTIVVQTAAAAATQTAALIPPTLTPSFTPFPTKTASITPTNTATFVIPSKTNTPKPTKTPLPATQKSGGGGSGGGGSTTTASWSCSLVSQIPNDNTHFAPGTIFNANWTVKNTGDAAWMHTTVDIVYSSGSKLSAQLLFDTSADTSVGNNYVVSVPMTVPASPGTYSMVWSLQANMNTFCPLPLTILVP